MITHINDTIYTLDLSDPLTFQLVLFIIFAFMTISWMFSDLITKKIEQIKHKKVK